METELRDTTEKLRKTMEASARQQSDYMTAKEQLTSLEKAKVKDQYSTQIMHVTVCACISCSLCVHMYLTMYVSSCTGCSGSTSA